MADIDRGGLETMTRPATKQKVKTSERDAERWAAVAGRDAACDGTFVYAVATTGIYCRPSCPSRRAKRQHVVFFDAPADAEIGGYRACLRCRPQELGSTTRDAARVAEACRMIETAECQPTLLTLANAASLSTFHFHRLFKRVLGITPKAYADGVRSQKLREELASSQSVTDAIYAAGFGSNARFYAQSGALIGMTPTAYKVGGRNETLKVAIRASALGRVLVAATDKGLAAVLLGDTDAALRAELHKRLPKAKLIDGDKAFEKLVARVVEVVDTPSKACDVPLDIQGTAFQHRVWRALRAVPAGQTASYAEIARDIGQPNAVRAVARACAANPAAVLVPCHRIVRGDGALSGYRWGIERKRKLLASEAEAARPNAGRRAPRRRSD